MIRSSGSLTARDELLRGTLLTKDSRHVYLTVGPSTMLDCSFCHPSRPSTYVLYALPTNTLLPHLLHFTIIGLATSAALTSHATSRYRTKMLLGALSLLALDLYATLYATIYPTSVFLQSNQPPMSVYTWLRALRPLSFCVLDATFAFYIWASCTNRFIFFPFLSDPNAAGSASVEALQAQTQDLVRTSALAMQSTQAKLRAANVAHNTVVRDQSLKRREDEYWTEVREVEGDDEDLYQDERVQAAIARVYGQGGVDVPRARREAGAFVDGVMRSMAADDDGRL